jgi:hypothetical protein
VEIEPADVRVVLDSDIHVATLTLPGGRADVCPRGSAPGRYVALLSEPTLGETARGSNAACDAAALRYPAIYD